MYYVNGLQRLIVQALGREIEHSSIRASERNSGIGLAGVPGLGDRVLAVEKGFEFDQTGRLTIYPGKPTHDLDVGITRSIVALHAAFGIEVHRHAEEDGRVKYYVYPAVGPVQDTDLGTFNGDEAQQLVAAVREIPPSGDVTADILRRAEHIGRDLHLLPRWSLSEDRD